MPKKAKRTERKMQSKRDERKDSKSGEVFAGYDDCGLSFMIQHLLRGDIACSEPLRKERRRVEMRKA